MLNGGLGGSGGLGGGAGGGGVTTARRASVMPLRHALASWPVQLRSSVSRTVLAVSGAGSGNVASHCRVEPAAHVAAGACSV